MNHTLILLTALLLAPLAESHVADAPANLLPPWQHQDIGSAQVGHKVPSVPVEKFGKNALFGKSGLIAGTAQHSDSVFTVQGTMDIWGPMDGGHFVWQPVQGDFVFVARVASMDNPGGNKHAKAGLCLRETLEGGSRNISQCITPVDGTQFLYRETTDGKTVRISPDAAAPRSSVPKETFPCWLKLVRSGNEFSGYESLDGETWWLTGTLKLDFKADAFIGLSSSSHTTNTLTTSVFDHVQLSTSKAGAGTKSAKNRRAQLMTIGIDGSDKRLIYETTTGLEAPNWSPDGKWLVCNGGGALWRIAADGSGQPEKIPTGNVQKVNNDHVLAPNGRTIYFSAAGHLYAVPFAGGQPRRVSNDQPPARQYKYFLHGVSPDEQTLAYVGVESANGDPWGRMDLFTIPAAGGADTRLTNTPAPDDGPEYSSDGKWIYFNSELNAKLPGHAQCYRMKPDGTGIEQLTHDERVNWFPHVSPDGRWIVYISFPPGTVKHPADKDVILRRMRPDGSEQADIIAFNGGQGTINVNSWSPDSQRFAFVMYPKIGETPAPASMPEPAKSHEIR
jgi:Tol biopolymer transport system component